ncbi:Anthranilate N-methyltransferase, partial [Linum grandiflorum]
LHNHTNTSMASAGNNGNNETKGESFEYAMCIANGIVVPMTVLAANELGILDIIAEAGRDAKLTASEVVSKMAAVNKNNASIMVDRILRLLATHSIVDCTIGSSSHRRYSLNSVSNYFVRNQNGVSLSHLMSLHHDKSRIQCWFELKDTVLEGGVPFDRANNGTSVFEYYSRNPKLTEVFSLAMYSLSTILTEALLNCYKGFQEVKQLVDVGGGFGDSAKAITSKYPHITAINFDLPHVIKQAPPIPGVEHIGGDMFESVPKGEAIFMKSVLHDWSDDHCLRLLKNCYEAVPAEGKVIVVDMVIPTVGVETNTAAKMTAVADVLMMTVTQGGKERTQDEFMALATKAGFRRTSFKCSIFSAIWVIEFYK